MAEPEKAWGCGRFAGGPAVTGLGMGMVLWVGFCLVAVGARGIRWDETFEHAQVLTGQVPYPEGHPLRVYLSQIYSIQPHLSAGLLRLGACPGLVCGARNFLFLLAGVLPVYLLAALLTRWVLAGHLAALLMLQGILLEFDGSYPMAVWPELYSNGPIGGGWALLTLGALLGGWFRLAGLMAGLMPCIHVGQWPPILAVCAVVAMVAFWRGDRRRAIHAALFGGMGLAVCALFYFALGRQGLKPPVDGPFAGASDPWEVWRGYTMLFDPHRRFPPANGHIALIGTLILAAVAEWRARDADARRIYLGVLLYTAVVAAAVWIIMIVQASATLNTPFLLISWMPYRLINHIPPLGLALAVGILMRRDSHAEASAGRMASAGKMPFMRGVHARYAAFVVVVTLLGVLQPVAAMVLGDALYGRYLSTGEWAAFVLFGAALSAALGGGWRGMAGTVLAAFCLVPYHQFGAACIFAGAIAAVGLQRMASSERAFPAGKGRFMLLPALQSAIAVRCLVALVMAALLLHQARYRQSLSMTDFERRAAGFLGQNTPPGTLLAGPPDGILLQARLGRPVLAESATPSLLSYAPALGPGIEHLWKSLYGVSFESADATTAIWQDIWRNRTAAQWRALAGIFGVTYVVAPSDVPLQLPLEFQDSTAALYSAKDTWVIPVPPRDQAKE